MSVSECKVGQYELQGRRRYMEDKSAICLNMKNNFSYFAVYDGHGGDTTSDYLQKHLGNKISELDDLFDHKKITEVIQTIDNEFHEENEHLSYVGSTCVFAIVREIMIEMDQGYPLLIGNIGDSRAMIIGTDGKLKFMTNDHKPSKDEERNRIVEAGGHTFLDRVDGQLAVSRAVGDWAYKDNQTLQPHQQKVISVPDLYNQTIFSGELLLIASDGVFEHVEDQQIVSFVHGKYTAQKLTGKVDLTAIASDLINWCFMTNYSQDNMSAILVVL